MRRFILFATTTLSAIAGCGQQAYSAPSMELRALAITIGIRSREKLRNTTAPPEIIADTESDLFQPYETPDDLPPHLEPFDPADHSDIPELDSDPDLLGMQFYLECLLSDVHLIVITAPNCVFCDEYKPEVADLIDSGWHVDIKDASQCPVLVGYLEIDEAWPTTLCFHRGIEVARIIGRVDSGKVADICNTAIRKAKRAREEQDGPSMAIDPPNIHRSQSAMPCFKFQNQWTWPGGTIQSLIEHLIGPPHNFDREIVEQLSNGQLVAAHNSWHDKYGGRYGRSKRRKMHKRNRRNRTSVTPTLL